MCNGRQLVMQSFGFPAISSPSAQVLILGSLPGQLSLERAEYYASPQNVFWRIVATRVGDLPPDYAGRVAALVKHRVAVWDVLVRPVQGASMPQSRRMLSLTTFARSSTPIPTSCLLASMVRRPRSFTIAMLCRHSRTLSARSRSRCYHPRAEFMRV